MCKNTCNNLLPPPPPPPPTPFYITHTHTRKTKTKKLNIPVSHFLLNIQKITFMATLDILSNKWYSKLREYLYGLLLVTWVTMATHTIWHYLTLYWAEMHKTSSDALKLILVIMRQVREKETIKQTYDLTLVSVNGIFFLSHNSMETLNWKFSLQKQMELIKELTLTNCI